MKKGKVTPKKRGTISDEEIILALEAHYGIVASAAKVLNISREHLSRLISASETLKDACKKAREKVCDLAENTLVMAMLDGDVTAAIFVCKTIGKKRGYTEKQEVEHSGGITVRWAKSEEEANGGM